MVSKRTPETAMGSVELCSFVWAAILNQVLLSVGMRSETYHKQAVADFAQNRSLFNRNDHAHVLLCYSGKWRKSFRNFGVRSETCNLQAIADFTKNRS